VFYRLLNPAPPGTSVLTPLRRVSEETRARLVREIDEKGPGNLTLNAIGELEQHNPELLQMAHDFASGWKITCTPCRGLHYCTSR
jgi:hypothetical protein